MPPRSLRYTDDDVLKAIDEVSRGTSIAAAAKKYGIPRITLLYKVKGKAPVKRRMGPMSYLSEDQENNFVKWILTLSKAGFPVTMNQLQNSVKKFVTDLKIKTPFSNNRPGRHWCESFKRKHPEISARVSQNLTETRASVTPEKLKTWFTEVMTYLETNNQADVLNCPDRVFNCDETAFFLNPKGSKVLAARGDKTVYQKVNPDEKECLTVLLTGNAAGDTPPPMIVFKYERIPRELALSVPDKWGIGRSENGWMTGETFYEFISNIFNPWLKDKKIQKPVILFIDGHSSHLTLHTSKFCSENGIILVALYPNATHLIQPMDVAVFRSLKGNWKEAVREWRIEHNDEPILRKIYFCPLLKKVLDNTLKPSIFRNGFRKCGLVPWDPNAVSVTSDNISRKQLAEDQTAADLKNGLSFIEKHIGQDKLTSFKSTHIWTGDIEDKSLFLFWRDINNKYEASKEALAHKRQSVIMMAETQIELPVTPATSCTEHLPHPTETSEHEGSSTGRTESEVIHSKESDSTLNVTNLQLEQDSAILDRNEAILSPTTSTVNFLNASEMEEALSNLEPPSDTLVLETIVTPLKPQISEPSFITPAKDDSSQDLRVTVLTNTTNTITNSACTPKNPNTLADPVPSTSTFDPNIPTPFKRILFWPQQKEMPLKKRKFEKIPAVVTSEKWQEYYENKDKKKSELLLEKQKRAEERKNNKEKKEAEKLAKKDTTEKRKKIQLKKINIQNNSEILKTRAANINARKTPVQNATKTLFRSDTDSDTDVAVFSTSKTSDPIPLLNINPRMIKHNTMGEKKDFKKGINTGNKYLKKRVDSSSESEYEEWQESRGSRY